MADIQVELQQWTNNKAKTAWNIINSLRSSKDTAIKHIILNSGNVKITNPKQVADTFNDFLCKCNALPAPDRLAQDEPTGDPSENKNEPLRNF